MRVRLRINISCRTGLNPRMPCSGVKILLSRARRRLVTGSVTVFVRFVAIRSRFMTVLVISYACLGRACRVNLARLNVVMTMAQRTIIGIVMNTYLDC